MAEYEKVLHSPTTNNVNSKFLSKGDVETQSPITEVRFQDEKIVEDTDEKNAPARKYSVEWWKRTWDGAVRLGMWPRLVYCGAGLVLLAAWIGVMLRLVGTVVIYEEKNLQVAATPRRIQGMEDGVQFIVLKGSLISFDMEKRILAVSWSGLSASNTADPPVEFGDLDNPNSSKSSLGIEVYRDVSSVPYRFAWVNDGQEYHHWLYQIDNKTARPIGMIGLHPWDSFDTDITFTQKKPKNPWLQPLLGYPFDQWHGEIVFVANDLGTAEFYNNTKGAGVMEIGGIQLADSTLNWKFSYKFNNTCTGYNNVTLDFDTDDITTLPPWCHTKVEFDGMRPSLLIFCAIAAVCVNWMCAIFIFILTCEAIIMRRSYMLQGTDILSMCFTALFALPTIRLLLPGAPAYGAVIDLIGILPCTLLVALCAVCVSIAKLNKRYKIMKEE